MTARMKEYLRRNELHCAAVGLEAGLAAAFVRLGSQKRPPKWLVESLRGLLGRACRVSVEMASHRDEVSPCKK